MVKPICKVNISDIAAFIGQNTYDVITPFERMWKRCDETNYKQLVTRMETQVQEQQRKVAVLNTQLQQLEEKKANNEITNEEYSTKSKEVTTSKKTIEQNVEQTQSKIDKVQKTQKQQLETVVGESVVKKLHDNTININEKKKLLDTTVKTLKLDTKVAQEVTKEGTSFINKQYGIASEDDALTMFEKKYAIKLTQQVCKTLCLQKVSEHSQYDWYMIGKVDGLCDDYIVEIKNRAKKFFTTLREYEKTQIQMYMLVFGIPRCHLVEKFQEKLRVTEVLQDIGYTRDVLKRLEHFIHQFETVFLNDTDAKLHYLHMTQSNKNAYIWNMFINSYTCDDEDDSDSEAVCYID